MTVIDIPTLQTERLTLRMPLPKDFETYADFCASERSIFVGGPFNRSASFGRLSALIGHWHLRGFGRWLVADRETDEALGVVGPFYPEGWPEPEIAWTVFEAAEGRGVAYEASFAARQFAYEQLGWNTVISLIDAKNERSAVLAKRLGATLERTYDHADFGKMNVWRHPAPETLK